MSNFNIQNVIVKRKYIELLKEAEGLSISTTDKIEKSIFIYESFDNHSDFRTFNSDKAIKYKIWLRNKKHNEKVISLITYRNHLKNLKKFFTWLCAQPGFKSKIKPDNVRYLNISDSEDKMATQYVLRKFPSLDEVICVVNAIDVNTEIDLRDKALISFAALSGIRANALTSLPKVCFDPETLIIYQDPKQGVHTKFSKLILSTLFKFDEKMVQSVLDWFNHLTAKNFNPYDPLFPRNKVKKGGDNLSFKESDEVEPCFWKGTGSMREIFKKRFKAANLPYYSPHTFRHLTIHLAFKNCKNGEQIKAVSQNFGHENISTTIGSYANHQPDELSKILKTIDFSNKELKKESELLEKIQEILNSRK